MRSKNQQGYIALVTAIILAAIVATVTFLLAGTSLLGRYNTLIFNDKKASRFLAESCLEVARLKLVQNSSYIGNETVAIGSSSCAIGQIQTAAGVKIILVSASAGNGKTVLKLTVDTANLEEIKLEELIN